jgi:hypothetical protein
MNNTEWKALSPKRKLNEYALAVVIGTVIGVICSFGLGSM